MSYFSEMITHRLSAGYTALDEHQSKLLLAEYGSPVVPENIAHSEDEALASALEIGFPVVLKGCGPELKHKSDLGLVHINIGNESEVRFAYRSIMNKKEPLVDNVLVQAMFTGQREFVAGLFRDEQFGPVIMFGLGGVYTEALEDITFRIAPFREKDPGEMLHEIRSSRLLGPIRGQSQVKEDDIVQILTGLAKLAHDHPEVMEVDINPLVITSKGMVKAVDALVVLGHPVESQAQTISSSPVELAAIFSPKSVAFVGASGKMGKWGHSLPTNVISGGFPGRIYPVNPKGGKLFDRQVYPSLLEIPGDIDLVVVSIPADKVMELIPQMKTKNVKGMILVSSGFSETGPEGKAKEEELTREARKAGIIFLGPNTMGLSNPHANFHCTGAIVRPKSGSTAMISQSGNMGAQLLSFAVRQGIGMRIFCGSGNEALLTIEDFLEAMLNDPLTETVMLYVESIKDGQRFFRTIRDLARKKPVILLKGGESRAGDKAASSHTGALGSNTKVFNALCRQTGALKVNGPMDLLHMAAAFSALPLPRGNKVAIITVGGGWGVITADLCARYGLQVPELPAYIREDIDSMLPDYWSRSNPIDLVGERDMELPIKVLESVLKWEDCDAVINLGILGRGVMLNRYLEAISKSDPNYHQSLLEKESQDSAIAEDNYISKVAGLTTKYDKPVFGVRLESAFEDKTINEVQNCRYKAVFYETPENAVKVCAKMYGYYKFLHSENKR